MNIDAMLKDLAAERVGDLVPLLRRAYELGFREGMASTGQAVRPVESPLPAADPPPVSDAAANGVVPMAAAALEPPPEETTEDGADEDEDDEEPAGNEKPMYPGIRASATVGGLLRKIERVFRLEERFDLVVRIENPRTGRALPRHVRLSSYLRQE